MGSLTRGLGCTRKILQIFALVTVFGIIPLAARADLLDWDAVDWTTNALSQSYVINGTTVTVTLTGNTGNFIIFSGVDSPDDATLVNGGTTNSVTGTGQAEALYLGVDHPSRAETIIVTITFSRLVTINALPIFDIDVFGGNSFQDQIRNISATDGTNTYFGNLTATNAAFVTTNNSGTAAADFTAVLNSGTGGNGAGNQTSDGTGTISFGSNAVNSVTFTYGNGTGAIANPTSQHVALGDINFTVIPEPSQIVVALFLVGTAAGYSWRKKGREQTPIG
jgi:hypothetical protein